MLGDLIYEQKGKITSQRVLDAEGAKMETSFSGSANYRGTDGTEVGTYSSILRPEGVLYGEGQGVITSKDGEVATWTGSGNRKIYRSRKNKISWPIILPYTLDR
jgi:hypothetical protein